MKFKKMISLFLVSTFITTSLGRITYAQDKSQVEIASEGTKGKNERYRTLSTVSMILEREMGGKTEILLQLRQTTGWMDNFWDLGACGHVDEGETLTDAVVRETKEELCIDVSPENIEFVSLNHNNLGKKGVYYCFYMKVKNYSGEIKIGEPNKCAELRWFDIENLPENIISIRKDAIEDYRKGIIYNETGWEKKDIKSNNFSNRYKTCSSVEMLIERENNGKTEILLQLRKNKDWMNNFWDFSATGHIEEGETVTEAAIRETKEELSIDISKNDVEFVSVNHNNFGEFGVYYCFCMRVKNYSGEIKIGEPDKCAELKWFDIENLPENIIPARKSVLEDYQKGIIYNEIGWEKKDMTNEIKETQSEHFNISYDSGCDEKLVSDIINVMENNCKRIESHLKVKLDKLVEVKLYSNKEQFLSDIRLIPDFKNAQDWVHGIGYFDLICMLLTDKTHDQFLKMAVHELVHVINHKINASPLDKIPLLEGVATYEAEYPFYEFKAEHLPNSIEELFSIHDVGHPEYLEKMYSCGHSFVKFTVENYGYDKFIELYKKDYSSNVFGDEIREIFEKWIVATKSEFSKIKCSAFKSQK